MPHATTYTDRPGSDTPNDPGPDIPDDQPDPDVTTLTCAGRSGAGYIKSCPVIAATILAAKRIDTVRRLGPGSCCDTLVRTDLESRWRSILLAYLETLLQHAEAAMCRHSPEGYATARLRLDILSRLLGERPRTIFGQDDGANPQSVTAFVPRFAPLNPRLMEIYDQVADQLDALHHCLTKARLKAGDLHSGYVVLG